MKKHLILAMSACATILLGMACCGPRQLEAALPTEPVVVEAITSDYSAPLFDFIVLALTLETQPNAPVVVEVKNGLADQGYWGMEWWDEDAGVYRIEIEAAQPFYSLLDTLVHEWGHVMVHDDCQAGGHDALWGVAYARAYRIALRAQRAFNTPMPPTFFFPPFEVPPPADTPPAEDE